MQIEIGTRVHATRMANDSFYKQVIGTLVEIKNGFAVIKADRVMDKCSTAFEAHPSTCTTSARVDDVVVV